jgi:hypothetical protein
LPLPLLSLFILVRVLFYCFLIYFLFYGAASSSFYTLSKLKVLPFVKVYSRIITISYKAYTLLSNLELYASLSKFRSSIFIILGSIATSLLLLHVPRFTSGSVSLLKLLSTLSIPCWCSTILFRIALLPIDPRTLYALDSGSRVTSRVKSLILTS